jgi:hypothetical protein
MAPERSDDQTLLNSLIGQVAAGITLAAAFIYGAGALTVALRLYFTRLPWESVVGQMPHDLIITTGFGQVILPAVIIGMLGAVLLNFLVNQPHDSEGRSFTRFVSCKVRTYMQGTPGPFHAIVWLLVALMLGATGAAISLYNYINHRNALYITRANGNKVPDQFTITPTSYFISVATLCAIAVGVALILLPKPRGNSDARLADGNHASDNQGLDVLEQTPKPMPVGKRQSRTSRPTTWKALLSVMILTLLRKTRKNSGAPSADSRQASDNPVQDAGATGRVRTKSGPASSRLSTWEWKAVVGVLIAFAAIPSIAAFSASTLFPYTFACSTMFNNRELMGNLIATNGGWAYMVQYRPVTENGKTNFYGYFQVVPLSSVQLLSIGTYANCKALKT